MAPFGSLFSLRPRCVVLPSFAAVVLVLQPLQLPPMLLCGWCCGLGDCLSKFSGLALDPANITVPQLRLQLDHLCLQLLMGPLQGTRSAAALVQLMTVHLC